MLSTPKSKFANGCGILLAADLPSPTEILRILDEVSPFIAAIKIGNPVLYRTGFDVVQMIKDRFPIPVVLDIKLCDVAHVARMVVGDAVDAGADAIIVAGVCGPEVVHEAARICGATTEVWVFTEFTSDSGLIKEKLADDIAKMAASLPVQGVQAPGTRPYRIEDIREIVGSDRCVVACGIGVQGGRFGSAIRSGANLEIIGRSIYGSARPGEVASDAQRVLNSVWQSNRVSGIA